LYQELAAGGAVLRGALLSQPRVYSKAGRRLKAPTWMPSGSNGFSSAGGRRLGGVVAMVAVSRSGPSGGAPGRF
jgi:hypothetical protein